MGTILRSRRQVRPEVPVEALDARARLPLPAVPLAEAGAAGVNLVGAKAVNLGLALRAGLPVLPGFVLTTSASRALFSGGGRATDAFREALARAWSDVSQDGTIPLVVRSSSPGEDQRTSSMAGRFTSVVGVRGWTAFLDAVGAVVQSAGRAFGDGVAPIAAPPMAVLVQPYLEPRLSGVLFGIDPVTGLADRRVVAAVEGGPQPLVSGEVDGTRYVLSPRGRILERDGAPLRPGLNRRDRRALLALARRAAEVLGGPQDIEWALEAGDRIYLLQSRPVTATGPGRGAGPLLGPGPVAETFPDPLAPLEEDLWLPPLRRAVAETLRFTGAASRRRIAASPILTTVGGRVAADLDLLGARPGPPSCWSRLDPRPPVRRLGAAWRVGRLRAALPGLAADVVAGVDGELAAVPALGSLADDALLLLLGRAQQALVSVHGFELLTGPLLPEPAPVTAAALALDAVAAGRAAGQGDQEVIAHHPVALTLSAPAIARRRDLPLTALGVVGSPRGLEALGPREALRLRARWLHELTARAAWELGRRLADRAVLEGPGDAGLLSSAELEAAVRASTAPADLDGRRLRPEAPLPVAFRLAPGGVVVPLGRPARHPGQGRGASPGRGVGPVHAGPLPPGEAAVLVVRTLDPGLAPYLPGLAGLVAETGSVLSHLAILAREYRIPTVVGMEGALTRFPPGTSVLVDGSTGEVRPADEREDRRAWA